MYIIKRSKLWLQEHKCCGGKNVVFLYAIKIMNSMFIITIDLCKPQNNQNPSEIDTHTQKKIKSIKSNQYKKIIK